MVYYLFTLFISRFLQDFKCIKLNLRFLYSSVQKWPINRTIECLLKAEQCLNTLYSFSYPKSPVKWGLLSSPFYRQRTEALKLNQVPKYIAKAVFVLQAAIWQWNLLQRIFISPWHRNISIWAVDIWYQMRKQLDPKKPIYCFYPPFQFCVQCVHRTSQLLFPPGQPPVLPISVFQCLALYLAHKKSSKNFELSSW